MEHTHTDTYTSPKQKLGPDSLLGISAFPGGGQHFLCLPLPKLMGSAFNQQLRAAAHSVAVGEDSLQFVGHAIGIISWKIISYVILPSIVKSIFTPSQLSQELGTWRHRQSLLNCSVAWCYVSSLRGCPCKNWYYFPGHHSLSHTAFSLKTLPGLMAASSGYHELLTFFCIILWPLHSAEKPWFSFHMWQECYMQKRTLHP